MVPTASWNWADDPCARFDKEIRIGVAKESGRRAAVLASRIEGCRARESGEFGQVRLIKAER